jgi:hypothetical protein
VGTLPLGEPGALDAEDGVTAGADDGVVTVVAGADDGPAARDGAAAGDGAAAVDGAGSDEQLAKRRPTAASAATVVDRGRGVRGLAATPSSIPAAAAASQFAAVLLPELAELDVAGLAFGAESDFFSDPDFSDPDFSALTSAFSGDLAPEPFAGLPDLLFSRESVR